MAIKKDQSPACIWLTRPLNQAGSLERRLIQAGARVLHLPMLQIEPLYNDGQWGQKTKSRILNLDSYDLVFFISSNAAKFGMSCITDYWPQYPVQVLNFAVGSTTAEVLENYGLEVHYPKQAMTSEALLGLPELKAVEGKKGLIVRGLGGRELLAQGLMAKGVEVDTVELYQRKVPKYEINYLQKCFQSKHPTWIVVSSGEALDNLVRLFQKHCPLIFKVTLLVSSERIKELALTLGFQHIIIMPGANDEAIINTYSKL